MCDYSLNDKRTYYKVYYPDFEGYSGIRKFYTSYFGKDVLVSERTKNGKLTHQNEFSVYSSKGILLFAVHVSWIATMFDEYVEMPADRWRPKRRERPGPVLTLSMAASGATPIVVDDMARALESVQIFPTMGDILRSAIKEEPEPVVLPPKADFSHLTFEQLFDV